MLPPSSVTPARSNAFRYCTTSALRSSSVMTGSFPEVGGLGDGLRLGDPLGVGGDGRPVGQGEDRAQGGPAGPVGLGRGRGDAVADPVQAGDGAVLVVQDLAVGGGLGAALGVQGPAGDQGGVVGAGV